jgi:hypothetical protein
MASGTTTSPVAVVIDATVVIALCANEADKLANAEAKIKEYSGKGCTFFMPLASLSRNACSFSAESSVTAF